VPCHDHGFRRGNIPCHHHLCRRESSTPVLSMEWISSPLFRVFLVLGDLVSLLLSPVFVFAAPLANLKKTSISLNYADYKT
jgi:hypothetical protein